MRPIPGQADADHGLEQGTRERRPQDWRLGEPPLAGNIPGLSHEALPAGVKCLRAKDGMDQHIMWQTGIAQPDAKDQLAF